MQVKKSVSELVQVKKTVSETGRVKMSVSKVEWVKKLASEQGNSKSQFPNRASQKVSFQTRECQKVSFWTRSIKKRLRNIYVYQASITNHESLLLYSVHCTVVWLPTWPSHFELIDSLPESHPSDSGLGIRSLIVLFSYMALIFI